MSARYESPRAPIVVTAVDTAHGWSGGNDHLIDDSRGAEMVGRSYASVRTARAAADARVPWPARVAYVDAWGRAWIDTTRSTDGRRIERGSSRDPSRDECDECGK